MSVTAACEIAFVLVATSTTASIPGRGSGSSGDSGVVRIPGDNPRKLAGRTRAHRPGSGARGCNEAA